MLLAAGGAGRRAAERVTCSRQRFAVIFKKRWSKPFHPGPFDDARCPHLQSQGHYLQGPWPGVCSKGVAFPGVCV